MFNTTQNNLGSYMDVGKNAVSDLQTLTGTGTGQQATTSWLLQNPMSNLSESALQATPGYQFNLSQGLESAQNAYAARGLGTSGAAMKGAETYATGLADSTYQNQFNNQVTNQTNDFNRLMSMSTMGENAAAGVGAAATQTGSNIGSNTIGAGNAQAAALMSGANSISNAASSYFTNNLLQGMYGSGSSSAADQYLNSSTSDQVAADVAAG
jgi:hypothetical protein